MNAIDVLDKLQENGELRCLTHQGLISTNVILWQKVYHSYGFQIENGSTKTNAINEVGDTFGIDRSTVYRILKKFNNKQRNGKENLH